VSDRTLFIVRFFWPDGFGELGDGYQKNHWVLLKGWYQLASIPINAK